MNLLEKLAEKSWEPAPAGSARDQAAQVGPSSRLAMQKTALWIFMVIISVFFSLFFITFITHSQYPGFQALAANPWAPLANARPLWLNTFILALSSLSLHRALVAVRRKQPGHTLVAMVMAMAFALIFVLAQLWLWRQVSALGYSLTGNPANSYFYLLTAIHGLHLLGGLVVLVRTSLLYAGGTPADKIEACLLLCARYWHYLLILWLVLFGLLTASPETYNTIAALCGLGV